MAKRGKMETVTDLIFLGSKITEDSDCSHELKRCLLLGGKAITKLDRVLKSRDIILLTQVCIVKAMVFPVVMYGCDSWTIKKAEWPKYWSFSLSISPSKNTQDWSPLGWIGWISLQSKGLSRVFSNTTVQKHQFFGAQLSL